MNQTIRDIVEFIRTNPDDIATLIASDLTTQERLNLIQILTMENLRAVRPKSPDAVLRAEAYARVNARADEIHPRGKTCRMKGCPHAPTRIDDVQMSLCQYHSGRSTMPGVKPVSMCTCGRLNWVMPKKGTELGACISCLWIMECGQKNVDQFCEDYGAN